jgi:hypothetical protein
VHAAGIYVDECRAAVGETGVHLVCTGCEVCAGRQVIEVSHLPARRKRAASQTYFLLQLNTLVGQAYNRVALMPLQIDRYFDWDAYSKFTLSSVSLGLCA